MLNRFSRRLFCTASPQPWLFVGLGNPGDKYRGTRHNVGFEMIDAFAESQGIPMDTVHCKAIFGQGFVGDVPVFLAKPQTYMNLSGESTGPLAAYYKLPLNRVVVFHDDMGLPCGVLRLHHKGGHERHNGGIAASALGNGSRGGVVAVCTTTRPRERTGACAWLNLPEISKFLNFSAPRHFPPCFVSVEERDLSFSREQRISSAKNWHWKTSWSNGSQSILAPEVQCNSSRTN